MSDTPRTEAEIDRPHGRWADTVTVDANFARRLERELNSVIKDNDEARERIKLLEQVGDWMSESLGNSIDAKAWKLAKEAKP